MSDAQKCIENGWTVGTHLVGDEGYGPTVIRITAIGEERILAKTVSRNGKPPRYTEPDENWTLDYRDWEVASQPTGEPTAPSPNSAPTE